ncbi:aldehyde dehydrogenase family protein [Streptomyces sp. SID3343]|uniref:aldehyde dehydrogenase family protein n=1 Tax=Streptomyces sp. SID3343 TaxID=2690260 RepID=UPI00136E05C4|nr:aldehyde dehydrogenase family protein [Streptomyces sp. SID3343]MYW05296.1 aldehyde dehydrogenase family protein [Streptomyces sp. SID3343]
MTLDIRTVARAGLLIGGKWRAGGLGRFDDVSPVDGSVVAAVADGDVTDMRDAVRAARVAFDSGPWPRLSAAERSACLGELAAALTRHQGFFDALARIEWGVANDRPGQVMAAASIAAGAAQLALVPAEEPLSGPGATGTLVHEPHGVVAAITPWNYPHTLNLTKVANAIAAGNTVVLKPSPLSPLAALALAWIVDTETNIPPGVVNVVSTTSLDAARALTRDDRVDMISFTGSTAVGKGIAADAAGTLKRVVLELGGKSASIHLDDLGSDAYETLAAQALFDGCTRHAGQVCVLQSRLFVPAAREREIVERLVALAAAVRVGDPRDDATDMGPLISGTQAGRVLADIEGAVADGAVIAHGGGLVEGPGTGHYVAPTVLTGVANTMRIAREEVFGPVLAVIPYRDVDEAVAMANDSRFGLVGAVHGADVDRAGAVARRIRAGQVTVNGARALGPFGGFRESGLGREQGLAGLREFTETKGVSRPA